MTKDNVNERSFLSSKKINLWFRFFVDVLVWKRHMFPTFMKMTENEINGPFKDEDSYYDLMLRIIKEECWAHLKLKITQTEAVKLEKYSATLVEVTDATMKKRNKGHIFFLELQITQGNGPHGENFRKGCVFELSSRENTGPTYSRSFAVMRKFHEERTANPMFVICCEEHKTISNLHASFGHLFRPGSRWELSFCANLDSLQKMSAPCFRRPAIPFLKQLMGVHLSQEELAQEPEVKVKKAKKDFMLGKRGRDGDSEDDESEDEDTESDSDDDSEFMDTFEDATRRFTDTGDHERTVELLKEREIDDNLCGDDADLSAIAPSVPLEPVEPVESGFKPDPVGVAGFNKKPVEVGEDSVPMEVVGNEQSPPRFNNVLRGLANSNDLVEALNTSQKQALWECAAKFLKEDATTGQVSKWSGRYGSLSMVQGPPGCGKTHLVSGLLHVVGAAKMKTMVCAASNKAVCVTLEKFLKNGGGELEQKIVLVGVQSNLVQYLERDTSSNGVRRDSIVEPPISGFDVFADIYHRNLGKSMGMFAA